MCVHMHTYMHVIAVGTRDFITTQRLYRASTPVVCVCACGCSLKVKDSHAMSETLRPMFDELLAKYDDPANTDKITAVQGKLDVTTNVMQVNT